LEPACWIAMRRASRVILAGDHQQLPPTIKNYDAMRGGLGKTLMERVVENVPESVATLNVQYRMNDAIMRFSSDWFYGGKLTSAPDVQNRGILDLDTPIQWVDTAHFREDNTSENDDESTLPDFHEQFVGESHGRINKPEAELCIKTLTDYINKIGKQRFIDERLDVGIISPYRVQAQYIRSLIKKDEELRPFRKSITVNTVDGFQGQERDIIIISMVRSNEHGQIGFLNDLRRMNVAMTRARMKLMIIGDSDTLTHHTFYKKLHEYINTL
ncbi:MAG: helicase, partial [Bacteroidaceae bacterium]|nr:helicase [Bacteroidaceae bacterium]